MTEERSKYPDMSVRGISLISFREYVKSRLQNEEFEVFLSRLSPDDKEKILAPDKNEWYPFDVQRRLRELIAAWFNPQNPSRAVFDACLFTAEYEMSSFLKGIIGYLPVQMVINRAAALWGKYYQPGTLTVLSLERGAALELTGFPADNLFGPTMTAWLTVAAKHIKLKNAKVSQTADIHRGDHAWRWEIYWE